MNIRHGRCGHVIEYRRIEPKAKGAVAVEVGICAWCDRRKCQRCGRMEVTGTASHCAWCGSPIRLTAS